MNQSNVQNALANALQAAGVRRTDATTKAVTSDIEDLQGSLSNAFAAVLAGGGLQFPGTPLQTDTEVAFVKPLALADITDGFGSTRPTLFQPDIEDGEGKPITVETKPWKLEHGSDAYPVVIGAANTTTDLAATLMSTAFDNGRTSSSPLTTELHGITSAVTGSSVLDGSVQQLVQAMAGFSPLGSGQSASGSMLPDLMNALATNSQIQF